METTLQILVTQNFYNKELEYDWFTTATFFKGDLDKSLFFAEESP